jgi:glycosyltransferase involved in cell wall biosynthesis
LARGVQVSSPRLLEWVESTLESSMRSSEGNEMKTSGAAGGQVPADARRPKVVVVMPAYNAARTLRMTYMELPHESVDMVILVDDGSTDDTVSVARSLNLKLFLHNRNYGYGANQKTCYAEAIRAGADIIVMVHPDYQYDPRLLPDIISPIQRGEADVVLGSRLKSGSALNSGMPWWKYISNRFLTGVENWVFGLHLSEYHTGYRAYRRQVLERVNFTANSDTFIFDQEIIAQIVEADFRIAEIPVPTRYFAEASSASFLASVRYGFGILWLTARYLAHRSGGWRQRQFQSLRDRYRAVV